MPPSESQGRGGQEAPSQLLLSHPREETLANSPVAFAGCEFLTLLSHEILVETATLLEPLGIFFGSGPELSWLVAASLCLPHPALMICLHLLLLNLVQHGQLAVLCLLTPWEPCSACPGLPCSWERPRDPGNWGISPGWEQTGVQ